jgi:hypothetical protein
MQKLLVILEGISNQNLGLKAPLLLWERGWE